MYIVQFSNEYINKTNIQMETKICENCGAEHEGKYGSGRFCSLKCSRGFSTKAKRKEINEKLSKRSSANFIYDSITDTKIRIMYKRTCTVCGSTFDSIYTNAQCCSKKCIGIIGGNSIKKDTSRMGGLRDGGGKTKVYEYENIHGEKMKLNIFEIRVAKVMDSLNIKWARNWKGFAYRTLDEKDRKYYPDFYLSEYDTYVEFKGWVNEYTTHKMNDAKEKNNIKLIIIYSADKRYKDLGLNIDDLEINPDKLIELTKLTN